MSSPFDDWSNEDVADTLADIIKDALKPLEARVAELETRPVGSRGCSWGGTWRHGTKYAEVGTLATHSGSLWLLVTATPSGDPPGQGPDWRLVVKRGAYRGEAATERDA